MIELEKMGLYIPFDKDRYHKYLARYALLPLSVITFILVSTFSLDATVIFDFEGPVLIDPGKKVKDHSLILVDGLFHIFYIRGDGTSFGHATSPDLLHWTIQSPVLETGPESWDSNNIWAPCIVSYPNSSHTLLMYYTGVNGFAAQRTCLASTVEPSTWHKVPTSVFVPLEGDTSWAQWNENEYSNFRDPCFYKENGTCFLTATIRTKNGYGAIAIARSEDYFNWQDAGPLYIHNNWHVLESSFILKRNGKYHLFFTEENVGGVSHMSSDSLMTGWDIIKRSIIDSGHAAELFDIGSDRHLISRHTSYSSPSGISVSTIRFDTLTWNEDMPEVEISDPFEDRWTILWGTAFDYQPVFGNNPLYRGDDTTVVGFEGNWWIGTYEKFNGPLRGTSPGMTQGDEPRGAIRSWTFTIIGRSMRFLVGGGEYPDSCYIALCDAGSGKVIYSETGRGTDLMDERIWCLDPYRGTDVYLLIVDDCSAPFGHINVDGIEERWHPAPPSPGDDCIKPKPDKGKMIIQDRASAGIEGAEVPEITQSIGNYPNPFNPETEIIVRGSPYRNMAVVIYSVSGAEMNLLHVKTDASGIGLVRWNGQDSFGRAVSAGVYIAVLKEGPNTIATCKLILVR